jgi:DNA phosphorothioation-dependent restriction protein DptG
MSENLEIEEWVTMIQFNEMKQSMEEKQEKLSQNLQEIIAQLRIHHNVHDNINNQDDEAEETNEQIVAWLAREQQLQGPQATAHAGRPPIFGP